MTIVIDEKNRELFPPSVRRRAGIKIGDELEVKVSGGIITMLPVPPKADDEYTPAQRRYIDARLDEAEKSPLIGPFDSAEEMIAHLRGQLKKRAKKIKRSR